MLPLCAFTAIAQDNSVADKNMVIPESDEATYEKTLDYIEHLQRSKDIDGLEKAAQKAQQQWKNKAAPTYAKLMLSIAQTFSTYDFGASNSIRQLQLAKWYANLGIDKAEFLSIDTEVALVPLATLRVSNFPQQITNESSSLRLKEAELWLHAWRRIEASIDKNFDFKKVPSFKVTPPSGTHLPTGIAPSEIEDVALRTQYQAALDKNAQVAERYREQRRLQTLNEIFPKQAEEYIVSSYSLLPYNMPELKKLLDEYVVDEKAQNRILDSVAKAMRLTVEGAPSNVVAP